MKRLPNAVRAIRGTAALLGIGVLFLLSGIYVRLFLWPGVWLFPARRGAWVGAYMRFMSRCVFRLLGLAGARVRRVGWFRSDAPSLVIMNHQSLLDIPTATLMCGPRAPRFVNRKWYSRGVPAVSPAIRLSDGPVIDPDGGPRAAVRLLQDCARTADGALLIFPEGRRSRDGSIGRFHVAGLTAMLRERRLPVYLIVTDGFWRCRELADFVYHVDRVEGQTQLFGPFESPPDEAHIPAFIEGLRRRMIERQRELRAKGTVTPE